jgi:hypothetical protein
VAGSFLGKSPLSQPVSVDRVPEDTDKTAKKKKKSKNKLKNLLTNKRSRRTYVSQSITTSFAKVLASKFEDFPVNNGSQVPTNI